MKNHRPPPGIRPWWRTLFPSLGYAPGGGPPPPPWDTLLEEDLTPLGYAPGGGPSSPLGYAPGGGPPLPWDTPLVEDPRPLPGIRPWRRLRLEGGRPEAAQKIKYILDQWPGEQQWSTPSSSFIQISPGMFSVIIKENNKPARDSVNQPPPPPPKKTKKFHL